MEYVSGKVKLRDILLDNGNWWKFYCKNCHLLRPAIIFNIIKVLSCRTGLLGFHSFKCEPCDVVKKFPHTCKSRSCSSCGKKATDAWIEKASNTLPDTTWQHITFTMPGQIWPLFWVNRHLMNLLPAIAAGIIIALAKEKGFLPGIFLAIHTAGRDLKNNYHIHLSTTIGGLSADHTSWIKSAYFYHETLKKMWRYQVIDLLRKEFKAGRIKLHAALNQIKTYSQFQQWTSQFYNVSWVVHLTEQSQDKKQNINYLGKYLKRPPIGETRIKNYDGETVTFDYLDHYTDTTKTMTLPVMDFIGRLVSHTPDINFRLIRYYGFLANRVRGELLPVVYRLLGMQNPSEDSANISSCTTWREMIKNTFNIDPLKCPRCGKTMMLSFISFGNYKSLRFKHKEIANGTYPLLSWA